MVETPRGSVLIPTLDEMIRVKAWLILTRNAYRDYLDLAALSEIAGTERTLDALARFDEFYVDVGSKRIARGAFPSLQLIRQLVAPAPHDLAKEIELEHYRAVEGRWNQNDVLIKCEEIAFKLAGRLLSNDFAIENAQ